MIRAGDISGPWGGTGSALLGWRLSRITDPTFHQEVWSLLSEDSTQREARRSRSLTYRLGYLIVFLL
jgi:hypothetical protein